VSDSVKDGIRLSVFDGIGSGTKLIQRYPLSNIRTGNPTLPSSKDAKRDIYPCLGQHRDND